MLRDFPPHDRARGVRPVCADWLTRRGWIVFVKIGRSRNGGTKRGGRIVLFSIRREGKGVGLMISISHQVLAELGWNHRGTVAVSIGADTNCGLVQVEADDYGRRMALPTPRAAYSEIRIPLGMVWVLPVMPKRKQEEIRDFQVVDGRLLFQWPGDFTRQLRAAQDKVSPRTRRAA